MIQGLTPIFYLSEGNVSITPCHPSYMALVSTMTGLPPVRMRHPLLGTLNNEDLTPLALEVGKESIF